jgi:hypothetical protein
MSYLVVRKYNYKTVPNSFYLVYNTTDFQDAVKKKNELEKFKEKNVDILEFVHLQIIWIGNRCDNIDNGSWYRIWYHGSLTRRKYGKEKKKEKRRLKKK